MVWKIIQFKALPILSFIVGLSLMASTVWASKESDLIQWQLSQGSKVKYGSIVIETKALNQMYSLNGYLHLWSLPKISALKKLLQSASRHGLNPSEYWSEKQEKATANITAESWISIDLIASDALARYADDLSNGRIHNPGEVDDDLKIERKAFTDFPILIQAIEFDNQMRELTDSLAPQIEKYNQLRVYLEQLQSWNQNNEMPELTGYSSEMRLSDSSPLIAKIRKRLQMLGYKVATESAVFDAELQQVVLQYQKLNSIPTTGVVGSLTFRSLAKSAKERARSVEVNLEKLRWLPRNLEPRYLFVNLAFQELEVRESQQLVFSMKTVNGRPERHTPMMKDLITVVELNPTWTVPFRLATQDKLPLLQKNPHYLLDHDFKIYDGDTDQELDSLSIDWNQITPENFNYTLVQQPSRSNALGVMKFPLKNPWAIYLHDTNEPELMKETKRLLSSGCVRLEDPMKLALYLLRDQPKYDFLGIAQNLPQPNSNNVAPREMRIKVKDPLVVYTVYLTVDVTSAGEFRFAEDLYEQDLRLRQAGF